MTDHTSTAVPKKSSHNGHRVSTPANTPLEPAKITPDELQEEVFHEAPRRVRAWLDSGYDFPLYEACMNVAAKHGLTVAQVPALVEDVLQFMEEIHIKKFTRKGKHT